jgi:D-alanyl-D-alanine endopeptidase (penicillin-binding protein 7)
MKKIALFLLVGAMTILAAFPVARAAEGKSSVEQSLASKKAAPKKAASSKAASKKTGHRQTRKTAAAKPRVRKVVARPEADWSGDPATLGSAFVVVMEQASGKILLEKNPDAQLPIASISKLMTAMVVLDAGQDMEEIMTISEQDIDALKGTRSRLQVGTVMTRDTALLLALMSSENRAAHALGRHYPGGLPAFVAAMNRKARALGLVATRFEEPTGLSANNVSTPRELAHMTAAAHQYAKIREYSTMAEASLAMGNSVLTFSNTNTLVKNPQWQIGLSKTGYISEAGRCLVMQTWIGERPVVMVLLDSSGAMTRVGDANRIRRWMEAWGQKPAFGERMKVSLRPEAVHHHAKAFILPDAGKLPRRYG